METKKEAKKVTTGKKEETTEKMELKEKKLDPKTAKKQKAKKARTPIFTDEFKEKAKKVWSWTWKIGIGVAGAGLTAYGVKKVYDASKTHDVATEEPQNYDLVTTISEDGKTMTTTIVDIEPPKVDDIPEI